MRDRNTRTGEPEITYEVAAKRLLTAIAMGDKLNIRITNKAQAGDLIWPNNDMKAQGLAGAASRIIKRMEREGLIIWVHHNGFDKDVYQQMRMTAKGEKLIA
jgi:hypothetical protein